MNIHLMIILLNFTQPQFTQEPLELITASQIVAPADIWEDTHTLQEIKDLNHKVWLKQQLVYYRDASCGTDVYFGKDGKYKVSWWELA